MGEVAELDFALRVGPAVDVNVASLNVERVIWQIQQAGSFCLASRVVCYISTWSDYRSPHVVIQDRLTVRLVYTETEFIQIISRPPRSKGKATDPLYKGSVFKYPLAQAH